MSVPNPSSVPLPSPSKSSLRRPSGSRNSSNPGTTPHFAPEATQRQFLPHSPPNQNLDYDEDEEVAVQDSSLYTAPPQLQPFFTLIEDTLTNEHHHPIVHYIFADDDQDIITDAACRALDSSSSPSSPSGHEDPNPDPLSRLPPPNPHIRDHYLILDIEPADTTSTTTHSASPRPSSISASPVPSTAAPPQPYTIVNTTSLSAHWQPTRALLTTAPTMVPDSPTETRGQEQKREQHLMLRIEGRGNTPPEDAGRVPGESLDQLIERLGRRLGEVRALLAQTTEESFGGELLGDTGGMFGRAVLDDTRRDGGGLDEQD